MDRITIPDPLKPQFAVPGPTELFDEAGRPLGLFLPKARKLPGEPDYTLEELERTRQQPGGKALAEILKSLGEQ
jgi:hypothetical protein